MAKKTTEVYLICPVRRCTPSVRKKMDAYVAKLESRGYKVHYPPRDVDQSNDDGGVRICAEHIDAMMGCDEVHVWWDPSSSGSHFDLGMAYMLTTIRTVLWMRLGHVGMEELKKTQDIQINLPLRFVIANPEQVTRDPEKSFTNVLLELAARARIRDRGMVFFLEEELEPGIRACLAEVGPHCVKCDRRIFSWTGKDEPPCSCSEKGVAEADYDHAKSLNVARMHGAVGPARAQAPAAATAPVVRAALGEDSGERFLGELDGIAQEDAAGLKKAYESYGPSWKQRGGVGAYMMACRKFDRLENRVRKLGYDVFRAIAEDDRGEGCIDDVRDLRRYLMLIEAEMRARGFQRVHRDNKTG